MPIPVIEKLMTHPQGEAQNLTTHPLQMTRKLMTHPLSAQAHSPPQYLLISPLMHLSPGQEKRLTFVLSEDSS